MKYICGPVWDERVVNIDIGNNPAILMSGGLDSWVLYNLLPQDVTIFNIKRKDGFDSAARIKLLTERDNIIEVDEASSDPSIRVGETVNHILTNYDVGELYLGLNRAPPVEYFPQFDTPQRPFRPWINTWPLIRTPLLHLYKYHIINLAIRNNISVINTLSCIAQLDIPCGKCWQCVERQWGYDQLQH